MKKQRGSILVIVLILAAAFYLLASLVLIVHRQYIDDVDLTQSAMLSRQKLLRASRTIDVNGQTKSIWPHCSEIVPPDVGTSFWYESEQIWLNQLQLPNECGYGQAAQYLWLQNDAEHPPLQVNVMTPKTEAWQTVIEEEYRGIEMRATESGWQLLINEGGQTTRLNLVGHDEDTVLWQRFRLMDDHYESVLLWQAPTHLMLEHIVIPFEHLSLGMMHEANVRRVNYVGQGQLVLTHMNDRKLQNWQVKIQDWQPQHIEVQDDVIWLSMHAGHERVLLAMHLDGEGFYQDQTVGLIYPEQALSVDKPIILKPCDRTEPWIIDEDWQVGCRVQKRVRYAFAE